MRTRHVLGAVLLGSLSVIVPCIGTSAEDAQPFDVAKNFVASGWMGDGEQGEKYVQLAEGCTSNPHSGPNCIQVTYSKGPKGFAGVYWQNKPNNWGDKPGDDFSKRNYARVSFWARGDKGGEIIEFKAGGIDAPGKPHKDSFEVALGKEPLKKEWTKYTIGLEGKDLSSVIGGFCWVANASANSGHVKFYVDDIQYEPAGDAFGAVGSAGATSER